MTWEDVQRVTLVLDVASGVGFALLGLWVLTLRPRSTPATALGAFCIGKGVQVAIGNAVTELRWLPPAWTVAAAAAAVLALGALAALSLWFPGPLPRRERLPAAALAALVFAAFVAAFFLAPLQGTFQSPFDQAVWGLMYAGTWSALAVAALRYPHAATADDRRGIVLVTLALGLEMVSRAGGYPVKIAFGSDSFGDAEPVPFLLAAAAVVLLWLRNIAAAPVEARRTARNVALFLAALLPASAVFVAATDPRIAFNLGIMGGARVVGILLLAYAILRLQLLGLDVGVRWGISKSSVAAAFIAVFFAASEAAQQFFGETLGSAYVGIAAAGVLVFAFAPLQRAAERLAERAVPVTPEAPAPARAAPSAAHRAYRKALLVALHDGAMTREEERHLADLAHELGLSYPEAVALRDEVERGVA